MASWNAQFTDSNPLSRQFWVSRVSIWDAHMLEQELRKVLSSQLNRIVPSKWLPHSTHLLALLIDIMSIGIGTADDSIAFYGAKAQNLEYRNEFGTHWHHSCHS